MNEIQMKALIDADVSPAHLLRAAQGPQIKEIAAQAGVSYTLAWRVANHPISWKSEAKGTKAVRRIIQEVLGFEIWDFSKPATPMDPITKAQIKSINTFEPFDDA